jgi:hypothetical protein
MYKNVPTGAAFIPAKRRRDPGGSWKPGGGNVIDKISCKAMLVNTKKAGKITKEVCRLPS